MNSLVVDVVVAAFLEGTKGLAVVKLTSGGAHWPTAEHRLIQMLLLIVRIIKQSVLAFVRQARSDLFGKVVLLQQQFKNVGLFTTHADLHAQLCLVKRLADLLVLLEDQVVERVSKSNGRLVLHFVLLFYANDVLSTRLLENRPDLLRVTRCDENKLQLDLILPNHLFKLVAADQLTAAAIIFEDKEIALAFKLLMEFCANLLVVL